MNRSIALALAVVFGLVSAAAQRPAGPVVVFVEIQVSAADGLTIPELAPAEFEVSIDGRRRRVVQARRMRPAASKSGGDSASVAANASPRYLLGIEPDDSDYDGNVHELLVQVNAGGRRLNVDGPTQVRLPKPDSLSAEAARPPQSAAMPSEADVAAWQQLWGGAEVVTAVEKAEAARTSRPAPASAAPANTAAPAGSAFETLFAKYSSGDVGVLGRELRTQADFERVRPELATTFARWRGEWSPRRAAFALELAITAFARRWPNPQSILDAARAVVTSRPDAPGRRPADDRFELKFHRVAAAMLAALEGPLAVESYLSSIQDRVRLRPAPGETAELEDARLVLSLAMARETQTLMLLASVGSRNDQPRRWTVAKDDTRLRRQLDGVLELLDLAAAVPDTRDEANVRRAFVKYRLGASQEALTLLEQTEATDDVVEFWRLLILGRVLTSMGRQSDAIAAYEHASALAPDAQTPAVALTTIFLERGDRDQALGWAERARTTTENRGDPWPQYWNGSSRFLRDWLEDLRDLRP